MSDYNCNALRNIAISDSLTQKLLSIPSTAKRQKKPVVIPLRCVMAAASMVLVFTLSISAILLGKYLLALFSNSSKQLQLFTIVVALFLPMPVIPLILSALSPTKHL